MTTHGLPDAAGDLPRIGRPALSALRAAGIDSLAQVAAHTDRELAALHGVGPRAITLLRDALAERGQGFASERMP